jgi:hypothetical protein
LRPTRSEAYWNVTQMLLTPRRDVVRAARPQGEQMAKPAEWATHTAGLFSRDARARMLIRFVTPDVHITKDPKTAEPPNRDLPDFSSRSQYESLWLVRRSGPALRL